MKGEAVAGAKLNFGKSEVYWPQDDDAHKKYQELVGLDTKTPERPDGLSIEPSFDVKVAVNAAIDVVVTPEVCISKTPSWQYTDHFYRQTWGSK